MPDFIARWHQFESENVNSWEFQFQRVGSDEWEWVQRVEPVDGCLDCFEAIVEIPDTAILVRSRAIGTDGISVWSDSKSVPEPGFAISIAIGIALIAWVAKRPYQRRSLTPGRAPRCKENRRLRVAGGR